MFAHEIFHNWQGANAGLRTDALPNWMNEGAAQLFAYMLWAKLDGKDNSYLALDPEELGYSRRLCTHPLSTPTYSSGDPVGCDYSKGMMAMEYFVYRFGIEGYSRVWTQIESTDLDQEFQRLLGTSFQRFNADLSEYLSRKGWGS